MKNNRHETQPTVLNEFTVQLLTGDFSEKFFFLSFFLLVPQPINSYTIHQIFIEKHYVSQLGYEDQ